MEKCRAMWERERKVEQALRAAESDDSAWAHAMEAKLHEYLSRRLRTTPIEVTGIDCRETFCEITGQGFVPEGDDEFRQALMDVQQQSWSDFSGSSFSQNVEAGKVIYTGEVRRMESYASFRQQRETPEQVACTRLLNRQQQREREALDAQARDHGWADPMEQLLRMHLMTQLKKHPLDELEIVCRTTVCSIKAVGRSSDALLAFQMAMNAVESEPWANLRSGDAGSSGYGDTWTADYTMHRR